MAYKKEDMYDEVGYSISCRVGLRSSRKKWIQIKGGDETNYKRNKPCGLCVNAYNLQWLSMSTKKTMCDFCKFADFLKSKGYRKGHSDVICMSGGRDNPDTMLRLFDEFEQWLDEGGK